jgi:flagellar hook-associated protein 2
MMRVGGLATGMDIEAMVNKLMQAERMPLNRMEQDRTQLTWKRDAFREINRSLLELSEMMSGTGFNMKLSPMYQSKTVTSSQEGAVTATGTTSASNGSYNINVTKLATNAINVGGNEVELDDQVNVSAGNIHFATYDDKGVKVLHEIAVNDGDTIKDVLKRINDGDNNVRAFYDTQSKKVIMETTRTGDYNKGGQEIVFEDDFLGFANQLGLVQGNETGGENASFTYNNGLHLESQNNSYDLNGINFQFNNVTDGNAILTVTNDVDAAFDNIMKFVDKYNEVIDKLNGSQTEERFRDFHPLTDEQKKEMSEDEIKKWEEKAQSGILRGESSLSNGMYALRQSWYATVDTGGAYTSLTQIGIKTTSNYMDGGKLQIDEEALKKALRENPEDVQKLFSNVDQGESRGLINRLEDSLKTTMKSIEEQAGKSTHTLDNYTIGKRMKALNDRIFDFEARMLKVENRFWNQFTQMEKAIQRLNDQSAQLFSQFG